MMRNHRQRGASIVEVILLICLIVVIAIGGYVLLFGTPKAQRIDQAIRSLGMTPSESYIEGDLAIGHFKDDRWICNARILLDVVESDDGEIQLFTPDSTPTHLADKETAQRVAQNICKALDG